MASLFCFALWIQVVYVKNQSGTLQILRYLSNSWCVRDRFQDKQPCPF